MDLANAYHNLAVLKEKQRQLDESKRLFLESLKLKEKLFEGVDHAELANCLNGLGSVCGKLDDNKNALMYSMRAYEMRLKLYESDFPHHIEITNSLHNLGVINEKLGRKTEAYEYFKRSNEMKKANENNVKSEMSYFKCKDWTHAQFLVWFNTNAINAKVLEKIQFSNKKGLSENVLQEYYDLSLSNEKEFDDKFHGVNRLDLEHFKNCLNDLFQLKIKSNYVI